MRKNLSDDLESDFQNGDIQAVNGFFDRMSEKIKRETYKKVFGREFDCPSRKIPPLPLDIAYGVALQELAKNN